MVQDCTYWPVLGVFNNYDVIAFPNKNTTTEEFDEINQVFLEDINDNMVSMVQSGKYGATNTTNTTKMGYFVIKYVLDAYTLQEVTTYDDKIITAGELIVKAQYLIHIK